MGAMLAVPTRRADLTAAWATRAVARRHPGAEVEAVRIVPLGVGTNARLRILVSYAGCDGPPSLFVKMPGRSVARLALLALGALASEARLAEATTGLPLEHPVFYGGGWTRTSAVVVSEDVEASGGRPNTPASPLTVDEVADGLSQLARLHARFWGLPLPEDLSFVRPWRLGRGWAPLSAASLRHGLAVLERAGRPDLVPPQLGAARLEREFRASSLRAREGPMTLLHGDPHPGNTYRPATGGVGFYDWQLVRTGNFTHDVSYFVVSCLSVEDRRRYERELLSEYLAVLAVLGVGAPTAKAAWAAYRSSPAFGYGTWLHTLSAGRFQARDACLAVLERFAAAYCDLAPHDDVVSD